MESTEDSKNKDRFSKLILVNLLVMNARLKYLKVITLWQKGDKDVGYEKNIGIDVLITRKKNMMRQPNRPKGQVRSIQSMENVKRLN